MKEDYQNSKSEFTTFKISGIPSEWKLYIIWVGEMLLG